MTNSHKRILFEEQRRFCLISLRSFTTYVHETKWIRRGAWQRGDGSEEGCWIGLADFYSFGPRECGGFGGWYGDHPILVRNLLYDAKEGTYSMVCNAYSYD